MLYQCVKFLSVFQVQYNRTIANIEAMKSDGRLSCRFTRDRSIDIGPTFWQWNDEDEEYHILMAKGDADKRGTYACALTSAVRTPVLVA